MSSPNPVEIITKPAGIVVPKVFEDAVTNLPKDALDPTKEEGRTVSANVIQTTDQLHQQAVNVITTNLGAAGHSVDAGKVSAVEEAERILREIREKTPGTDIIAETGHDMGRALSQTFGGSDYKDVVRPYSRIHLEPIRRVSKMANLWKKPFSIINWLFRRQKTP